MPPALHPGFSGMWRPPPALSSTLATFDCFCFSVYRERYDFEWAFFTHRRFFPCAASPDFWHNLLLSAGSSSLKFAGLNAYPWNTDPPHLFVWFTAIHNLDFQKNSFLIRTKYYHELLVIKSLVYLLLTHFELFSLALCKDYKKHFEQDLYCL